MKSRTESRGNGRDGPDAKLIGACLGGGAALGWVLHDLGVFLLGGEPGLVLRGLLPGSLLAIALGVVVGALLAERRRTQWVLVVLAAVVVWRFDSQRGQFRTAFHDLLRGVLSLLLTFRIGEAVRARLPRLAPLQLGVALGFVACAVKTSVRFGFAQGLPSSVLPLILLLLAAALVTRPATRRTATALALGLGLTWMAWSTHRAGALERADLGPPVAPARPGSPNLLLVVMDTVRADHLAPYGHDRVTTPHIDAFVRDHATLHLNARSTSPFTLPSHGSLMTGLYGGEHGASIGAAVSRPLRSEVTTLAERLREAGYRTGAVVANRYYLNASLGFDRGFEHFDSRAGTHVKAYVALAQGLARNMRLGHLYRDAERITDLALEWLETPRPEPFFLFLNYLDAHGPLSPPEDLRDLFEDERPGSLEWRLRRYDQELVGVDRQVARLLEQLHQSGRFDDTVIVLTSDHGESFGEHGIPFHCWALYDSIIKVPLFVKPAGGRRTAVDETPITGAEVHDLMLTEVGLQPPAGPERLPGLLSEWYPWPLTPHNVEMQAKIDHDMTSETLSWLRGGLKTVVYSEGKVEVYDIASDPGEIHPLPLSEAEREAALEEARAWWETHPVPSEAIELSEDQLDDLRALGYG